MNRAFHILTESETFSLDQKGALSYWVANMLRNDPEAIVVAPSHDDSTGFDPDRVRVAPVLGLYRSLLESLGWAFPWFARTSVLARGLTQTLVDLQAGDTVWVHNRPEVAVAIQKFVHRRGASLVLHLHHTELALWPRSITSALNADVCVFANRELQADAKAALPDLGRTAVLGIRAESEAFRPAALPRPRNERTQIVFSAVNAREEELRWFIEAMSHLEQSNSPVDGVVIRGREVNPRGSASSRRVRRVNLPANVRFEQPTSDHELGRTLRSADLFIRPGRWNEPAVSEVHQALACRLPIAEVGQIETQPNQHGYVPSLTLAQDSHSAATALKSLAANPETLRRLSVQAYRQYTQRVMWAGIHEEYNRILTSSRRAIGSEEIAEFFFAKA